MEAEEELIPIINQSFEQRHARRPGVGVVLRA
jgi:hypothetical protein